MFLRCLQYVKECNDSPEKCNFNFFNSNGQPINDKEIQQFNICSSGIPTKDLKSAPIQGQKAAFISEYLLWGVNDEITVSFMAPPTGYPGLQPQWDGTFLIPKTNFTDIVQTPDLMPKWKTKNELLAHVEPGFKFTEEDNKFEAEIRAMDPYKAIEYVVIQKLQPYVGVRFKFVDSGGLVRIALNNSGGSNSLLGTVCRLAKPTDSTMSLGWLSSSVILHEFGHVLGMIHEHQSPFGETIQWNIPAVLKWSRLTNNFTDTETCTNIISKEPKALIYNGSNYDPKSIMHYYYPRELTKNNTESFENIKLSDLDKEWLNKIYPLPTDNRQRIPAQVLNRIFESLVYFGGFLFILIFVMVLYKSFTTRGLEDPLKLEKYNFVIKISTRLFFIDTFIILMMYILT